MLKKHGIRILAGILILLIAAYLIPVPKTDFFEVYPKKDAASEQLREFLKIPVKKIRVNDVEWSYITAGKGDKTILFIHGMGGAYNLWWQQIFALKNQYRCISFSLPEKIDNLEDTFNGLMHILDAEKVENFYVVGTSMGGYIAQYLVYRIPERIEKAVFSNTFPPNKIIAKKNDKTSKIISFLPEIALHLIGKKKLKDELLPAGENDTLLTAFLPSLPFSKKQFVNRYRVVVDPFFPEPRRYAVKRIPKLIIESDNDPLVEKTLREKLKTLYPHAVVYTFHNKGHFPYINAAGTYNKVLSDFFSEPDPFKQIETTVNNYFNGRKHASKTLLKQSFNPDAVLYTVTNGEKQVISLTDYLKKVISDGPKQVQIQIMDGDIDGDMAVFKTEFRYPNVVYHDYLTLLRTTEGWKIQTKTFRKLP